MKTKKENHYCKLCKKYLGERGSDNDEEFYNSTCIDCADDYDVQNKDEDYLF